MEIILLGFSIAIVITLLFFSIKSAIILSKPYAIKLFSNNEKWKYSFNMTVILMIGFLCLLPIFFLVHIPILMLIFFIISALLSPIFLIVVNKLRIEAQILYYMEVDKIIKNTGSNLPWYYNNYFYTFISKEYRQFIKDGY